MTVFAVPAIKSLCEDTVQLPHASGKITIRSFYKEVEMVGHETISMADPVETLHNLSENREEKDMVFFVLEYVGTSVAASGYVVDGTRKFYA